MSYEDEVAGLVIHKTTPDDAGVYSCQATNIIGQVQTEGTLSVHSKYKYIFTMMVSSSPIWTKQTSTSHLKVLNTKKCMTYNNEVLAQNNHKNQTVKVLLHFSLLIFSWFFAVPNVFNYNFIAHPQLDYDNKLKSKQSIKAGGSLSLTVNISGIPSPKVAWLLDGETIEKSPRLTIETTEEFSTLTIKNATIEDAGNYKISAEVANIQKCHYNAIKENLDVQPQNFFLYFFVLVLII